MNTLENNHQGIKKWQLVMFGFIALFGFLLLWGSFFTVPAGHKAIVLRFGQVQDVVGDGLHLKIPFIDSRIIVDIRTRVGSGPANAGTRDLQNVDTEITLNYHLNGSALKQIYSNTGLDVEEKVVGPRIQENVKAVVSRFSAEELLTKRDVVKSQIASSLRSSLSAYNVIVEDVQITNFKYSKAFDDAIEAKQTAEQRALKAKNDLDRIKVEAEQKVTMAQAEAETIRIQSSAVKEQGGTDYVRLKAIEKWDGKLPQYAAGDAIPLINLSK